MGTPKIINVDDIVNQKIVSQNKSGFFESLMNNPINIMRIGGIIIVLGAIIGLIINSQSQTTDSPQDNTEFTNENLPIINPDFGTNYSGGGGIDTLYDDLGGNDPLKNGKLDANINIDTEKYSCKFNVKYEGEERRMIDCLSGCYNGDENSKFCESYIYNNTVDGGESLETLYDDAGGNDYSRVSGQYIANINISTGNNYDEGDDTSCGFTVEYEGKNERTVKCNNTDCPDKCKSYEYTNRITKGENGDTLLDDTYINRREDSEDEPCQYCNDNQKCVDDECVCIDGYEGEYCQKESSDSSSESSNNSNSNLVAFSIGYVLLLISVILLALISGSNRKFTLPTIFMFGIYAIIWGYVSKDWYWLIALWVVTVMTGIVSIANLAGNSGKLIKISEFMFIVFYIVNFFIMNS